MLSKGLNAYDAYKEYQRLRAAGVSQKDAIVQSGAQLLAPTEMAAINEYERMRQTGHSAQEAAAGAFGGYLGIMTQKSTPTGIAVNLLNRAAHTAGAPQAVTDTTTVAGNVVNFQAEVVKEGAKAWVNIADAARTGDAKAIDRQVGEWKQGDTPLAGYAMVTSIIADTASGKSFEAAVSEATKGGENGILARAGSFMGEVVYADVVGVTSMVDDLKAGKDFKTARKNAREKIYSSMGPNSKALKSVEKVNESVNKASDWVDKKVDQAEKKVDEATAWAGENVDKAGQWVEKKAQKTEAWATEQLDKASGAVGAAKDKAAAAWRGLWD